MNKVETAVAEWQQGGHFLNTRLGGHRVFTREFGSAQAAAADTLLLIHGFPESSFSFHKVVDGLCERFQRVVLFDFLGYGASDKPLEGYTYSLFEQADVAQDVWQQLGVTGGHVLAHDMGDSVLTELVARHVAGLMPASFSHGFQSFTFTNGSMVLELANLRIMQKALLSPLGAVFSRLSNAQTFYQQARSAHGNPSLSDDDLDALWHNVCQQDGQRKNHLIIQYLNDRKRFEKSRWLPALAQVQEPIHLCWGEDDAVARVEMAHHLKKQVCPSATLTTIPNVGHFCQIAEPEQWLKAVAAFYG